MSFKTLEFRDTSSKPAPKCNSKLVIDPPSSYVVLRPSAVGARGFSLQSAIAAAFSLVVRYPVPLEEYVTRALPTRVLG